MHKFFAKTLFLGKKVVFLPHCQSTNDEMMKMAKVRSVPEGTIVLTDNQLQGKGQRGNVWISEPGKNILMSILLRPIFLSISNQYLLNVISGLAVVDALSQYTSKSLQLKWPNDVYLEDKKVSGILVENNLRGVVFECGIIGIGVNINQKGFNSPQATSLSLEEGIVFERDTIIEEILVSLEKWYLKLKSERVQEILDSYHESLLWKGQLRQFRSSDRVFFGEIMGIDNHGALQIKREGKTQVFQIKEIEFIG